LRSHVRYSGGCIRGAGGSARGLTDFQLADAAIDGVLDAGFIAGEPGEGVGTIAIHVEGAGQEVSRDGRGGRGGRRIAVFLGAAFLILVVLPAGLVLLDDFMKAVTVDAGFGGEGAAETPLAVGDAQDQSFFGGADGLEAVPVIVEEEQEVFGVLVEQDVFIGAQAVEEAVAAGCVFAFGGAGAGGLFGVLTVGVYLGLGHVAVSSFMLRGGIWGIRAQFSQVAESTGKK